MPTDSNSGTLIEARLPIHATNAWNPTGHNLQPVPGCRLYYVYFDSLAGERTLVFLGDQHHLTFVADLEGQVPVDDLRATMLASHKLYPHVIDLDPAPGLPRPRSAER